MKHRKILHFDLDAFFCSVEENRDPALRGKTFVVGGSPTGRGVVAAASYAARQYGIHSAMPMARAVQRYPDLIIIRGQHGNYGEVSRQVMTYLENLSPLVQKLSIDEAFIDVSDLPDRASDIARNLQRQINRELNLPCSLGVAANKLVAKIANNIGKAEKRGNRPPNVIKIVPPGQEAAFLAPLPVKELWGVGPKMAEKLNKLGITTIGELAAWPDAGLVERFGKWGADLARRSKGIDDRPVSTEREVKSISNETTFTKDVIDQRKLEQTLRRLSESVGSRLRKQSLVANTIKLKLRWPDFTTLSRQTTVSQPISSDDQIYNEIKALFHANWHAGKPVRLIGVGVSGFSEGMGRQIGLWDVQAEETEQLQQTLDSLRDKFGKDVIGKAGVQRSTSRAKWDDDNKINGPTSS